MDSTEYKEYKKAFIYAFRNIRMNKELLAIAENELRPKIGLIPNSFYRYHKINTFLFDEIRRQYVYLAQASSFDDIYDSKLLIDINAPSSGIANMYSTEKAIIEDDNLSKELVEFSRKHIDALNKTFDYYNKKVDDRLRIACFTQKNTNIPMWYYYAQNHSGVCIEYDFSNLLSFEKLGWLFLPIVYPNQRDNNKYYEAYIHDNNIDIVGVRNSLVKSNDWKFEKEWRLIKLVDNPSEQIELPIKIKNIFFGLNCDSDDINKIINLIEKNSLKIGLYKLNVTHVGLKSERLSKAK